MNAIRNLWRWARVTIVGSDDKEFPFQQVSYLGKAGNAVMWFPYGFHANIPVDTLGLIVGVGGNSEARVMLPGSPKERIKPLAAGEIVVYHPSTGTKIHFKADGNININTIKTLNVIAATKVILNAPDVEIGDGTLQKLLNKAAMTLLNSHTHGGGSPMDQTLVEDTHTTRDLIAS